MRSVHILRTEMPLAGGHGGPYSTQNLGFRLTLFQSGVQIMPTSFQARKSLVQAESDFTK